MYAPDTHQISCRANVETLLESLLREESCRRYLLEITYPNIPCSIAQRLSTLTFHAEAQSRHLSCNSRGGGYGANEHTPDVVARGEMVAQLRRCTGGCGGHGLERSDLTVAPSLNMALSVS
jgi:hypothetical protein